MRYNVKTITYPKCQIYQKSKRKVHFDLCFQDSYGRFPACRNQKCFQHMSVRRVRFQKLAGYFSTIFPASNLKAFTYIIDIIIENIIDFIGNIIDLIGSDVKSLTFCTLCKHLCIPGPRPPFSTCFWFLSNWKYFLPQPCCSNVASFPFLWSH